ncbi:MAG: PfkB family carbohydrate kinase [Proteobacteria bacterium]|nr:PfkB family carbohydrate kinase [Pseudomonadota bacterium]
MSQQPQVLPFRALAREVSRLKRQGRRVGLVHSLFDGKQSVDRRFLFALGWSSEIVVATVPEDRAIDRREPGCLCELERLQYALATEGIDFIGLVPWQCGAKIIEQLKPDVYGYAGSNGGPSPAELDALSSVGGELFTLKRRGNAVVESHQRIAPLGRQQGRLLRDLGRAFSADQVIAEVETLRSIKVAVVGETIIDEYAYCDAIGKSGKEPMLVTRFHSCEEQGGGVIAVANHLSEFCDHVEVVSALGEFDRRESFVRAALRPGIRAHFTTKSGSPTIVKRRYLDAYSLAKMMGVYHMNASELQPSDEDAFCAALAGAVGRCDAVVCADYGHGLLTRRGIECLVEGARFLAVNTQLNAANTGFHTISKYRRADYACLHEGELRLDARDLLGDLAEVTARTVRGLGARSVLVTLGRKGTLLVTGDGGSHRCPALAATVLERIGAGDAVLALTSAAAAAGLPPELIGFLGNLAGAQAVSVLGNSASIRKSVLIESVRRLLPRATIPQTAAEQ